ncbi:MAG: endolytic transglycosylase MltG [Pseudomonadota bacterium]|nr:endolytic transglycosylase MltG [Pseudomonadota bacterium]
MVKTFYYIRKQLLFLVAIGFLISIFLGYEVAWRPLLKGPTSAEVLIRQGENITSISRQLKASGWIRSADLFRVVFLCNYPATSLKSGNYGISPGDTMLDLIHRIAKGDVLQEAFTIIEGSTWKMIWEKLNQDPRLQHSPEDEIVTFFSVLSKLPPNLGVEGLFLPNTYHFAAGVKDVEVLMHAYTDQVAYLEQQWPERDHKILIKNPYEALIIASMIEKESRLVSEYSKISGVIYNRIKRGMPLQIDATVLYGKKRPGPLTKADLAQVTPFNTYKKRGLPPTPIAMPRAETIYAALHPEVTDLLYYVVKQDGSHYFSKTYNEHLQAVRRYLKGKK